MDTINFPSLEEALKEKKITSKTYERVKIAKGYIEKKYKMKKIQEDEKRKDWELITQKLNELQITDKEAENIKKAIQHKEAEYSRIKRQKMTIREFEPIAIIGKGAFGEVRICRHIQSNEIYAIKKMKKEEMHTKNQILHIRAERDVLSEAKNSWIVDLKYSFQDDDFLYLVMEYLPGGDLMTLLMAKDILSEEEAKFYAAELVLAIESVHKLKCIHRDLKPDNVLIGKDGHIKLSDFGLSKKTDLSLYGDDENLSNINDNELQNLLNKETNLSKGKKKRIFAYSTVGTPDYIAPEVFTMKGYGPQIDWWSLGVILFEMLIGYAPFSSENPTITCKKILNFRQFLQFSSEIQISFEAMDLIKKLITDLDSRLGYNGADEIKSHPFFKNIDWDNIKKINPPFIPDIQNDYDTKYFDNFPDEEPFYPETKSYPKKVNKDICFVDFTYKRGMDEQKTSIVSALEVLESIKISLYKNELSDDKNHLRHVSALTNIKESDNNLKSSIAEQTLENLPTKEQHEDIQKDILTKLPQSEKELIKSNSHLKDIHLDKNIEIEKFNDTNSSLYHNNQKPTIVKNFSTKSHIDKGKDNINLISKESTKEDRMISNSNHGASKVNHPNTNNIIYNVYSPQGSKNFHQDNKANNHHPKNIINNEKLNKNKETITFEDKKMVDKRNYESSNNTIDKNPKINDKNTKTNNSNTNLVSINIQQTIGDKNNENKTKSGIGLTKNNINANNQTSTKNSNLQSLNLQKKSNSHKEEDNNSNSINEEISVGNVQNKANLIDKGATKKTTNCNTKAPQNQQYISTNYVKDFINSESNHKIDSKSNKIPINNQIKPQNKNSNTNNLVYSNLSVNTTSSNITKQISTKISNPSTNNNTKDIREPLSPTTSNAVKLKLSEKMESVKEKSTNAPMITSVKGLKIESALSHKNNNDGKYKK